ncbi:hypothetical protein CP532_2294 [Ophiocordyceps camponoti-leonardi (nom. inval.)]|nr:hypothetical protein CP532_2294 [Ophiocordyceps camponoti-leonardi (nom. inval.)]
MMASSLKLAVLLWSVKVLSYAQLVPWDPSMLSQGQGYNTFTGKSGAVNLVNITPSSTKSSRIKRSERRARDAETNYLYRPFTQQELISFCPDGLASLAASLSNASSTLARRDDDGMPAGVREYNSFQITDFEFVSIPLSTSENQNHLPINLNSDIGNCISSSAAIAGWGQAASVSGGYLNKDLFDKSVASFLVRVNVQKQPPFQKSEYSFDAEKAARLDPGSHYKSLGDRWTVRFIEGGAFYARVSVVTNQDGNDQDVEAAAKAVFNGWGVNTALSTEAKQNLQKLREKATIEIHKMSLGELASDNKAFFSLGSVVVAERNGDDFTSIVEGLKKEADEFYHQAHVHNKLLYAVLGEYDVLDAFSARKVNKPDYERHTEPNSARGHEKSLKRRETQARLALNHFTQWKSLERKVTKIVSNKVSGGQQFKNQKLTEISNSTQKIIEWVSHVARQWDKDVPIPTEDPGQFRNALEKLLDPEPKAVVDLQAFREQTKGIAFILDKIYIAQRQGTRDERAEAILPQLTTDLRRFLGGTSDQEKHFLDTGNGYIPLDRR